MFQALGPNSVVGAGNLLLVMERQVDYAVAATLKLQRERLKSIEVKREAVDDFEKYIDVCDKLTARDVINSLHNFFLQSYFPNVRINDYDF